jgi:hypothetical protein
LALGLKLVLSEKICSFYQRPSPSRPLLRPTQSNLPFLAAAILIEHKDGIGHLKVAVGRAEGAGSITCTRNILGGDETQVVAIASILRLDQNQGGTWRLF